MNENRIYKTHSEVVVLHDETRKVGNGHLEGHVLFFVPQKTKILFNKNLYAHQTLELFPLESLFKKICETRNKYNAIQKFHFKDISGGKWTKYNEAERQLVLLGVDALRSKGSKIFKKPLMCKMAVIFFDPPTRKNLDIYRGATKKEKKLRYNETILRMLLKGALHYFYDKDNTVKVLKIICDGKPSHRSLSKDRIILRLIQESLTGKLKEYVDISENAEIIHLNSDHKKHNPDSDEYKYANLLQMADMLLGSVIQSCLKGIRWQKLSPKIGEKVDDKKSIIAYPVKEMLDKRKRGAKFKYSGHYRSFAISRAYIKDGGWEFEDVMAKEITIDSKGNLLFHAIKEEPK